MIVTHIVNRPLQGAYAFIFSLARQWTMKATLVCLNHTSYSCQISKYFVMKLLVSRHTFFRYRLKENLKLITLSIDIHKTDCIEKPFQYLM